MSHQRARPVQQPLQHLDSNIPWRQAVPREQACKRAQTEHDALCPICSAFMQGWDALRQQQHVNACLDGPSHACPSRWTALNGLPVASGQLASLQPPKLAQPRLLVSRPGPISQTSGHQGQQQQLSGRQAFNHASASARLRSPSQSQVVYVDHSNDASALPVRPRKRAKTQDSISPSLDWTLSHEASMASHNSARKAEGAQPMAASCQDNKLMHERCSAHPTVADYPACSTAPVSGSVQRTRQLPENSPAFAQPKAPAEAASQLAPRYMQNTISANPQQHTQPGCIALQASRSQAMVSSESWQPRHSGIVIPDSHDGHGSHACSHSDGFELCIGSVPLPTTRSVMQSSIHAAAGSTFTTNLRFGEHSHPGMLHDIQQSAADSAAVRSNDRFSSSSSQDSATPAPATSVDPCQGSASRSAPQLGSTCLNPPPLVVSQGNLRQILAPQPAPALLSGSQFVSPRHRPGLPTAILDSQMIRVQDRTLQPQPLGHARISTASALTTLLTGSQRIQAAEASSQDQSWSRTKELLLLSQLYPQVGALGHSHLHTESQCSGRSLTQRTQAQLLLNVQHPQAPLWRLSCSFHGSKCLLESRTQERKAQATADKAMLANVNALKSAASGSQPGVPRCDQLLWDAGLPLMPLQADAGMAEPTSKQVASSALLQELQAAQDIIQQLQAMQADMEPGCLADEIAAAQETVDRLVASTQAVS
ncbi:hypothetical protein WJX74_001743 [Apatococcus lobatus]|uniref:Uncharacterized protein n=1 Tax=Apatococcus lobatus TaxID=904363 RepID=A0AAW1RS36_9CHLO